MTRVAVCMSGGFRTFQQTKDSFRTHVIDRLYRLGYQVDFYACITLDDSTKTWERDSLITQDERRIREAMNPFRPVKLEFVSKETAQQIPKNARQLYGIDRCFALTESEGSYDYYIRVRPDYYYLYSIPDPASNPSVCHSCYFFHAKGCDLIFIASRNVYESWWLAKVRPLLRRDMEWMGWAMENWLFQDTLVYKNKGFEGGLLRENSHLVIFSERGHEKSLSPNLGFTYEYRSGSIDVLMHLQQVLSKQLPLVIAFCCSAWLLLGSL